MEPTKFIQDTSEAKRILDFGNYTQKYQLALEYSIRSEPDFSGNTIFYFRDESSLTFVASALHIINKKTGDSYTC